MKFTPEQLAKAKEAASAEELLALAKENGLDLTEEEAKKFFAELHKEGELADEELSNVNGGSFCSGGSTYSSDPPYNLITTSGNSCSLYVERYKPWWSGSIKGTCWYCKYADANDAFITYCTKRKYGNDPLNK